MNYELKPKLSVHSSAFSIQRFSYALPHGRASVLKPFAPSAKKVLFNEPHSAIMRPHFVSRHVFSQPPREAQKLLFESTQAPEAMPKEIKKHKTVLDAIRSVDIISDLLEKHEGHFEHELDLEVIAYGRNYNGKKVGPYVHLYEYGAGEEVIREGDWGGNTFLITVAGHLDRDDRDKETDDNPKVGGVRAG